MKCKEIKLLLPDYIDNNLDKVVKNDIKLHISSCEICTEEIKELKKYKKELAKLPKATAPDDFLKNIYEKLEEPHFYEKIKKILLLPLNIPKEALGVAILAVVAFFYFNPTEQLKQAFMPEDKVIISEEEVLFESDIKTVKKEEKKPVVSKKTRPKTRVRGRINSRKRKMPPSEVIAEKKEEKTYIIVLSFNGSGSVKPDTSPMESKDMKKKEDSEKDIIVIEKRAAETKNTTLQFVTEDEDAKFRRKLKKIKEIATINKAKILQENVAKTNKTGKYILLEVPASEYNKLVNSLNNVGNLRKKSAPADIKNKNNLKLKIELID